MVAIHSLPEWIGKQNGMREYSSSSTKKKETKPQYHKIETWLALKWYRYKFSQNFRFESHTHTDIKGEIRSGGGGYFLVHQHHTHASKLEFYITLVDVTYLTFMWTFYRALAPTTTHAIATYRSLERVAQLHLTFYLLFLPRSHSLPFLLHQAHLEIVAVIVLQVLTASSTSKCTLS